MWCHLCQSPENLLGQAKSRKRSIQIKVNFLEFHKFSSILDRIKPDIVVQPPGPTLGPIKVVDPPRPSPSPPVVVNPSESKGNDHEVDDDDDDSDSSESESESESNGNDEKSKAYLDDYYQVLIKKVEKLEEKLSQINWSDDTFY